MPGAVAQATAAAPAGSATCAYAAYAFNEGSGSTIIDYSGNGRNLTVTGSNSWVGGHGSYVNAFQAGASGSDGAVWNAGATLPALAGDVTVQFWYMHTAGTTTTISHAGGLYSSAGTARLAGYSYRSRSSIASSPHFTLRDSAATIIDVGVNGTNADSSWHNAALVYHASGTMDEYLDGVLLSPTITPTTTNPIGNTVQYIGVGSTLSAALAQAVVQDMRVFNQALAPSDVTYYMNTPVAPYGVSGITAQVAAAAPTGTATGTVPGAVAQVSVAAPSGTAQSTVPGAVAQVNVAALAGLATASAPGAAGLVNVAAPLGTASGGSNVNVNGLVASVSASAPDGTASVSTAGAVSLVNVAAPTGSAAGGGAANVNGPTAAVVVAASPGLGNGTVPGAAAQVAVAAPLGVAGASVAEPTPNVSVAAPVGTATSTGNANVNGLTANVNVAAPVGTATRSGPVPGIVAAVAVAAPVGVVTGGLPTTSVAADVECGFWAYSPVTASVTIGFEAGQPVQFGLTTLASDPWTSMYPA